MRRNKGLNGCSSGLDDLSVMVLMVYIWTGIELDRLCNRYICVYISLLQPFVDDTRSELMIIIITPISKYYTNIKTFIYVSISVGGKFTKLYHKV